MSATADLVQVTAAPRARALPWSFAGIGLIFTLLWLELINHLKGEWSMNPQYSYGWCVPLLAGYLLWKRWDARPESRPASSRHWACALLVISALGLLPIRFIAEANPDWRLISWSLGLVVVAISLGALFLAGGLPWMRYFAFPVLFLLVAVPWPAQFEQSVVQGLMRVVTAINVTMLNLAGIVAVQHGNVIEVSTGPIGIEEACSGIRSLQATLMVSLFLGELYEFSFWRRATLVVTGAVLAFICNLIRTAILVWVGARNGVGAIGNWHDPAGWIILIICLFGLWLASLLMRPRTGIASSIAVRSHLTNEVLRCSHGALSPCGVDQNAPTERGGYSVTVYEMASSSRQPRALPLALVTSVALWILAVEVAVQLWYRSHEVTRNVQWTVEWPKSEMAYQQVAVAPEAESMLRYNEGGGGLWDDAGGHRWNMYFFRWLPGRTAALFVRNHRPDICLPASGMTMRSDTGLHLVRVNNFDLPIRAYRFDYNGQPLHVYYCYWDGRTTYSDADVDEDWTPAGRLRKVRQGKREAGTQMLELAVWGYTDDDQARDALILQLGRIIRAG